MYKCYDCNVNFEGGTFANYCSACYNRRSMVTALKEQEENRREFDRRAVESAEAERAYIQRREEVADSWARYEKKQRKQAKKAKAAEQARRDAMTQDQRDAEDQAIKEQNARNAASTARHNEWMIRQNGCDVIFNFISNVVYFFLLVFVGFIVFALFSGRIDSGVFVMLLMIGLTVVFGSIILILNPLRNLFVKLVAKDFNKSYGK
jgi:small-conductance mechanosensitive channel